MHRTVTGVVVALLAEGVDRNCQIRALNERQTVALLAEGVDRNLLKLAKYFKVTRRPPRGGRG